MSRIARDAGFADPLVIWDAPENAELQQMRHNPNVLMPGDKVFIPEKQTKQESGSTGQKHRFHLRGRNLMLMIRLTGFDNQPIVNTPCELHVENQTYLLTSDGDGIIEHSIPTSAEDGCLIFSDPHVPFDQTIRIKIGYLNPVNEPSGQRARLANLGYFITPEMGSQTEHAEEDEVRTFAQAVEEFQCDHGLKVDGICGQNTQSKLEKVHGC